MKNLLAAIILLCAASISVAQKAKVTAEPHFFGFVQPTVVKLPLPVYPRTSNLSGVVSVSVKIDEDGKISVLDDGDGPYPVCKNVTDLRVLALRAAAVAAAKKAVLKPALLDGRPASVGGRIIYNFQSADSAKKKNEVVTTGARVATEDDEQKEMRIDRITKLSSTNEIPKNESSKPNIDKNVSVAKVGAVDKDNSASSTGGLNPNHKSASGGLAAETDSPTKTLSSGVLNGKALRLDKPKYPATASAVRVSGQVAVQVLIDEQGNIYSAKAVSGHPLLRRNSEIAACESKFLPTLLSGQPVKVSGIVIYNYVP